MALVLVDALFTNKLRSRREPQPDRGPRRAWFDDRDTASLTEHEVSVHLAATVTCRYPRRDIADWHRLSSVSVIGVSTAQIEEDMSSESFVLAQF